MSSAVVLSISLLLGQSDARADRNACGVNSLVLVCAFVADQPPSEHVNRLLPMERAPFSLTELDRAARELGYQTYMAHWNSAVEARFTSAAILHVRANVKTSAVPDHFVACFGEVGDRICVADFPSRPTLMSKEDLAERWNGEVLYVERKGTTGVEAARFQSVVRQWLTYGGLVASLVLVATAMLMRGRQKQAHGTCISQTE